MSLCEGIGTLEDLQTTTELLVCKHTLTAAKKMIEEGNLISDIPEQNIANALFCTCKNGFLWYNNLTRYNAIEDFYILENIEPYRFGTPRLAFMV